MPGLNPDLFQRMIEQKEQMLQVRHRMMNEDPQEMAHAWATEILPFVVEVRSAEKAHGRLTKKQVDKAVQLRSQAAIQRVADRTTKALETVLSPAAIQAAFSLRDMAQSELDDPLVPSDPQLDEAELAERTGKHLARIQQMSDFFRRRFPKE